MANGAYIPLIGGENVVALLDTAAATFLNGTINGTVVAGRQGSMKTHLLVALDNSATPDVPATTAAALFSLKIACPPGFATPASAGLDGYDYSLLLPDVRAQVLAKDFNITLAAFPVDMTALITEFATACPNLASVVGRLTAMGSPDTTNPYGTLTYSFSGAATVAAITDAVIDVIVDFGASVSN